MDAAWKKGGQAHSYLLLCAQLTNFLSSFGGGESGRRGAGLFHQGQQARTRGCGAGVEGYKPGDTAGLVLEDRPPPRGTHSH